MYIKCTTDSKSRTCRHELHSGGQVKTRRMTFEGDDEETIIELCKDGYAWARNSKKCSLCPDRVPTHLGYRMNPKVLADFANGTAEHAKVRPAEEQGYYFLIFTAGKGMEHFICELCAERMHESLNYADDAFQGKIKCRHSHRPLFLSVKEIEATTKDVDTVRATRAEPQKRTNFATIEDFAKYFADGGEYAYSKGSKNGGTPCAIMNNAPQLCRCGGRHDESVMLFQQRSRNDIQQAAPYGPLCAEVVEAAGFRLFTGYLAFVREQIAVARSRNRTGGRTPDHIRNQMQFGSNQKSSREKRDDDPDKESSAVAAK